MTTGLNQYRWPVVLGDRVALAPHLDLWMAGVRFGEVVTIERVAALYNAQRYLVDYGEGVTERLVWCMADDLLGAVGNKVLAPSTVPAPHGVPLCGHPEHTGLVDEPNEYGFVCAEFDEDGSCIHSEHMMAAGL